MKKSKTVILGVVLVVASFLAESCDDPTKGEASWCVDKSGALVDPALCRQEQQRTAGNPSYLPNYLWYYVPNQGNADTDNRNGSSNQNAASASQNGNQNSNRKRHAGRGGFGSTAIFFTGAHA